jgi:hypothetical protein
MIKNQLFIYGFTSGMFDPLTTELCGLNQQPVYGLRVNGIWAIVSDLPTQEFTALDNSVLLEYLADYQRVNESVMVHSDVIPVKFGGMLPDVDLLQSAVKNNLSIIQTQIENVAGKVEMNVTASWQHFQEILKSLGDTESIYALKQQACQYPDQLNEIQLQVGRQIKVALDNLNENSAKRFITCLSAAADTYHDNPTLNDTMIFNTAFLLARSRMHDFETLLQSLDQDHGQEIFFRLLGPLPPYSFGSVRIEMANPVAVEQARQILELPISVTKADIRDAFRRLSRVWHPDRHQDDPKAQSRFEKITRAWQLLDQYCVNEQCSFEPGAVLKQIHFISNELPQTDSGRSSSISL